MLYMHNYAIFYKVADATFRFSENDQDVFPKLTTKINIKYIKANQTRSTIEISVRALNFHTWLLTRKTLKYFFE